MFGGEVAVSAIAGRARRHCHMVRITGKSYTGSRTSRRRGGSRRAVGAALSKLGKRG